MKTEYVLMHKDTPCAFIRIDADDGSLDEMKAFSQEHLPYMGTADTGKMKRWWQNRSIPGGREDLHRILKRAGCENPREYLAKNLALSVSDTYWICPVDMNLSWEEVKLQGRRTPEGIITFHNVSSYDRNASLGGQLNKFWDMNCDPPVLVKLTGLFSGQQSVNEVFASFLHKRQNSDFPYTEYWLDRTEDQDIVSKCHAFTTDQREFVPAYEILNAQKKENSVSLYDEYIAICAANGIRREIMQQFMDYQTLSDFMISNTDRHLMNFGVLRDPETLQFIAPAPIFDFGNSMFYAEGKKHYTRAGILDREIVSIHNREEAMIKHIKNRWIVKEELLPEMSEVQEFYISNGISEEKAEALAHNYDIKRELLHDYQNGKTISFFREQKEERMAVKRSVIP